MPKLTQTAISGASGESYVAGKLQEMGWSLGKILPDAGTDLLAISNDEGYPLGVQVKTGKSFFCHPAKENGIELGWWFYFNNEYLDLWTKNTAHIIVLVDTEKYIGYWAFFTSKNIRSTKHQHKILIPQNQTLDTNHAQSLWETVRKHYDVLQTTGTAWNNNIDNIDSQDLIRNALLTPRIIAPHPNNYHDLSGIEVLAIHVLMREELDQAWYYDDKEIPAYLPFPIPKSFSQACDSDDWSWNAAAAIHKYLCHGDSTLILNIDTKAVTADEKVASAILKSVVYIDDDKYDEAKNCVEKAHSTPNSELDEAWLYIQEARIYLALKNKDSISTASQKAYRAYRIVSK